MRLTRPARPRFGSALAALAIGCASLAGAASAAGLEPALRAALVACLLPVAPMAGRLDDLRAAGWQDVGEADRLAAARALAPGERVFRLGEFLIRPRHDPEVAAEALDGAADRLARDQARPGGAAEPWLRHPGAGAVLRLRRDQDRGLCLIAAPAGAGAIAAALDLPLQVRPARNPVLTLSEIGTAPEAAGRIAHLDFASGAFGDAAVLPQIATPLVRIPD